MRAEYLRIGYAYLWLLIMAGLAAVIGMGKVEEKTSYGLMPIVVAMATASPKWPIEVSRDRENIVPEKVLP